MASNFSVKWTAEVALQAKSVVKFLGRESDQLLTEDNGAAPCPFRRRYLGPGEYENAELMFCSFRRKQRENQNGEIDHVLITVQIMPARR